MNNSNGGYPPKKKILCVEDHQDTCTLIEFLLDDYEVHFTSNIKDSLDVFLKQSFHLCIIDNWLTDGYGLDLFRQIKKLDPNVPVIFASGVAQKQEIQKVLDYGAEAYLVKPYMPEDLQKLVEQLISS